MLFVSLIYTASCMYIWRMGKNGFTKEDRITKRPGPLIKMVTADKDLSTMM